MDPRPLAFGEQPYCYTQSHEMNLQTGFLGQLQCNLGESKDKFQAAFSPFHAGKVTSAFRTELTSVVNILRKSATYQRLMGSRSELAAFCEANPEHRIPDTRSEYGLRLDKESYSYLVRMDPNGSNQNIYIYCYQRKELDRHLTQAARGVPFLDTQNREVFRLADGDKLRIVPKEGKPRDFVCRYVDPSHMELQGAYYQLIDNRNFAELSKEQHDDLIPLRRSLPEHCYALLESENKLIRITKGVYGYHEISDIGEDGRAVVDAKNAEIGVTKAQEAAMLAGCLSGWEKPAADPKNYNEMGHMISEGVKMRGIDR